MSQAVKQLQYVPSITFRFIRKNVLCLVEVLSHAICDVQYYVNRGFVLLLFHWQKLDWNLMNWVPFYDYFTPCLHIGFPLLINLEWVHRLLSFGVHLAILIPQLVSGIYCSDGLVGNNLHLLSKPSVKHWGPMMKLLEELRWPRIWRKHFKVCDKYKIKWETSFGCCFVQGILWLQLCATGKPPQKTSGWYWNRA